MFVEHRVKKGHIAKDDKHENEQLTLIVSGSIQITIGNESRLLKNGEAVLIPSWVVHSVEVLEDSIVYEVFSPPRQEWIRAQSL
jgi:quercetin dioxygenase-like cupin family protein